MAKKVRRKLALLPTILFVVIVGGISLCFAALPRTGALTKVASTHETPPSALINVTVTPAGTYSIRFASTGFVFSGTIGRQAEHITTRPGQDGIGPYQETSFDYEGIQRSASIRVYTHRPVALLLAQYKATGPNIEPFPTFSAYPHTPYHLSYSDLFAVQHFDLSGKGGPLVFYDDQANTAILSAASHFVIASSQEQEGELSSGIDSAITELPAGYSQATMLTSAKGINTTFSTWGQALTDLEHKTRPSNQADVFLQYLSYWTDSGASYYYKDDPALGSYASTLLAIKQEYASKSVPLHAMQLDSWWYGPKGPDGGIITYTADPNIWPATSSAAAGTDSLQAFTQQLGLPTAVHTRWLSPISPYYTQYKTSGGVSIDPDYWTSAIAYVKQFAGAVMFEQDWMDRLAKPLLNLIDPETFMDTLAAATKNAGLTLQYCMELPSQILQGAKYSNLTTMRVSIDRFDKNRWEPALWASQLAKALGTWPWVDVFMSNEVDNVLLADLSAGPVGPGDALGSVNTSNLRQAVRADGLIVKPDAPLVPTDATYINDAKGNAASPMVAATYTDFGNGQKVVYVVAFPRPYNTAETATFTPADLGLSGSVYIYNYFNKQGQLADASKPFSTSISQLAYYIIVPVSQSGIGFLGDLNKFVSLGKERVMNVSMSGNSTKATIAFASNEQSVVLQGYASHKPSIKVEGSAYSLLYNQQSRLFTLSLTRPTRQNVRLYISPYSIRKALLF